MTPSIYDYRDNEIEVARRIRRERIARAVEAVVCIPLLVAEIIVLMLV